jgi:hypothetical protein
MREERRGGMNMKYIALLVVIFSILYAGVAFAQHERHDMSAMQAMPGMGTMQGNAHSHHMNGMYGNYPMTRDSSGTSWQPDSSPMEGIHLIKDGWTYMAHGFANAVYDDQGGPRGGEKFFSENMLSFMAQGEHQGPGTIGLRSMFSLEPLTIGKKGYPLLLQTGETANGVTPLIARQHPHDLFMELAASYSIPLPTAETSSVFFYFGLPGEPALGPPTFMHRFSGEDIPAAPITHHWMDSTHITFGVITAGYIRDNIKAEVSAFNGREPDQNRFDIESPKFNSFSARFSVNPAKDWAFQTSYGHITSPEQLQADVNTDRYTASAIYNKNFGENNWQTTLSWGINVNCPGHQLNGALLESTVCMKNTHTLFGRAETVEKDELFEGGSPLEGKVFTVTKLEIGYIYDITAIKHLKVGVGASGSASILPGTLQSSYDDMPLSFMVFCRAKLW